jgi:hypothetical protein
MHVIFKHFLHKEEMFFSYYLSLMKIMHAQFLHTKHIMYRNKGSLFLHYYIFLDINECLNGVCPSNSKCTNTDGSFSCNCIAGYQMVDGHCQGKF